MRQCEAILEELWIYNSAGNPEKVQGFIGVNLKWASTTPEIAPGGIVLSSRYVSLNPHRAEYCNIGRISSRKYQKEDEAKFFLDIPGTHKSNLRFLFEQVIYPHSQTNCLLPGKYAIKIKLYSENTPIRELFFEIAWSENWQNNENEMFRELTINQISKLEE